MYAYCSTYDYTYKFSKKSKVESAYWRARSLGITWDSQCVLWCGMARLQAYSLDNDKAVTNQVVPPVSVRHALLLVQLVWSRCFGGQLGKRTSLRDLCFWGRAGVCVCRIVLGLCFQNLRRLVVGEGLGRHGNSSGSHLEEVMSLEASMRRESCSMLLM
jgi:hypothetical protein